MPLLSLAEAARRAGVDRSTIHRKLKRGELSATSVAGGKRRIDTAELARAYPDIDLESADAPPQAQRATLRKQAEAENVAKINALEQRVAALEQDKTDLRHERDRLLGVIDTQMKLISDQRPRGLFGWFRRRESGD